MYISQYLVDVIYLWYYLYTKCLEDDLGDTVCEGDDVCSGAVSVIDEDESVFVVGAYIALLKTFESGEVDELSGVEFDEG